MKDSEFIELLNLYLDHEISATDAARLEAEVQANPSRRRLYREYCQMQKACRVLAADFQSEALPAGERKLVAFEPAVSARNRTGLYAVGGFVTAAACVALIFSGTRPDSGGARLPAGSQPVARDFRTGPSASATVTAENFVSAGGTRAIAQTVSVPVSREPAPATFVRGPRLRAGGIESGSVLAPNVGPGNAQFDWMRTVQLTPLPQRVPPEDLRFEARPVNLRPDARALGNGAAATAEIEMTAFRFVK